MSARILEQLQAGIIFGDQSAQEYIYLPAGELWLAEPLCIFEQGDQRRDISLAEAVSLVSKLSLRPTCHPRLGFKSC